MSVETPTHKHDEQIHRNEEFAEMVFHISHEKIEKIKTKYSDFLENKKWVQKMILAAGSVCRFNFKSLGDLFALTGKPEIKFMADDYFSKYLFARGLIAAQDFEYGVPPEKTRLFSISTYEHPVSKNSIEWFIYHDDLDGLLKFAEENDINLSDEVFIRINGEKFTNLVDFVCYCGALNILKYCVDKDLKFSRQTVQILIEGGSQQCIDFLATKKLSFDNTLIMAISKHHNKAAKWLLAEHKDDLFTLPNCAKFFNTRILVHILHEKKRNINEQDQNQNTCLHFAAINNDLILAHYLLRHGADKTIKERNGKTAADLAISDEMRAILA